MKSRRGQFYLIAAIIIIVIIFSIYTVSNYVKTEEEDTIVYDLKKEFGIESGKVDDFLIYNRYESTEYMESWIETYVENKGQSLDNFIVVYENETSLIMVKYSKSSSGGLCLGDSCWGETDRISNIKINVVVGSNIKINLGDSTLNFKVEPGKNFIIVIKEGKFVAS